MAAFTADSDPDVTPGVVVIGAGAMGTAWARAVHRHPRLTLAGVVDTDERRAKGLALRLRVPGLPVASSLDALAMPAPVRACVNATPPDEHFATTGRALESGLAVLSEKPFAADLSQAVQLTAAARDRGLPLMVSQSRRYQPGLEVLRRQVGAIGDLEHVRTEFRRVHAADGFRGSMAQPLLADMAVHAFDAVRHLTGAEPVSVYCETYGAGRGGFRGPGAARAFFEMSRGVRYSYSGSWHSPGLPTAWGGDWRLDGSAGAAVWDGAGTVRTTASDGEERAVPIGDDDAFDRDPVRQVSGPLDDFARLVCDGRRPWGEGSDNLLTMAMIESAVLSSRRGLPVTVDEVLEQAGADRVRGAGDRADAQAGRGEPCA